MKKVRPVSLSSMNRRQILSGLMKLLVFIGFIFLSIPFISTFSSSDIDEKQKTSSHWVITQSVAGLAEGEVKSLSWSGGLVWVYARNNEDIELLKSKSNLLKDNASLMSEQPEGMSNNFRSADERYFVFIPQENKRNCQVRLDKADEGILFSEPCFSSKYDAAGRIFKRSGHKDQQNLVVPNHVVENGILKIGIWTPKLK